MARTIMNLNQGEVVEIIAQTKTKKIARQIAEQIKHEFNKKGFDYQVTSWEEMGNLMRGIAAWVTVMYYIVISIFLAIITVLIILFLIKLRFLCIGFELK